MCHSWVASRNRPARPTNALGRRRLNVIVHRLSNASGEIVIRNDYAEMAPSGSPRVPVADPGVAIRRVDRSEVDRVAELVGSVTAEIPLFDWALGDAGRDPATRIWFARILLEPLVIAGQVIGAVRDGEIVGIAAYQLPPAERVAEREASDRDPRDIEMAMAIPGFVERAARMLDDGALPPPDAGAVNILAAAVRPDARGGVLLRMMAPIVHLCHRTDRRFYAWTARPELRDRWACLFEATVFGAREVDGMTLYGLASPPPSG